MPKESKFERDFIKKVEELLPGCFIIKGNSAHRPGVPDRTIFYGKRWGMVEVKKQTPGPGDYQPNQEWYIDHFNKMSFCMCVYPENEEEVLDAIQTAFRSRRTARVSKS